MSKKKSSVKETRTHYNYKLDKHITIFCCRDGTISFAQKGKPPFNGVALPVFSVDNFTEAETLQVLCCSKSQLDDDGLPGGTRYVIGIPFNRPQFDGTIDTLPNVAMHLERGYAMITKGKR